MVPIGTYSHTYVHTVYAQYGKTYKDELIIILLIIAERREEEEERKGGTVIFNTYLRSPIDLSR